MKNAKGNDDREDQLAEAIRTLACAIVNAANEFKAHSQLATKCDLDRMECRIMSKISEFSDRVNTKFNEIGTAVDGIVDDVAFLKEKIEELQNNPGPISPEDQATLDALEARVGTTSERVAALDAATARPPAAPVE